MSVLAISTPPNSASWIGPTARITTSRLPSNALKRVKTLARTISATVRLGAEGTSFTCPRAIRSRTSASVSPSSRELTALLARRAQA